MKKIILFSAIAFCVLLLLSLVIASNMGFKLNFGSITSINQLLSGSGIGLLTVTDNNTPPKTTLVLNLDAVQTQQNSNMGFKLNIISIPDEGISVQTPNGNLYTVKTNPDGSLAIIP